MTPEGIAARAKGKRARLDRLVAEMHAYYLAGASLEKTGRKFGRSSSCVREMFVCRGLELRPTPFRIPPRDPRTGRHLRQRQLSGTEIEQLISDTPRLRVPSAIRVEWRAWTLERRGSFVRRLREKLGQDDRPTGAFSANVTPFDYGSAEAHAIAKALNAGLDSRAARCKIDICSQGVIYRGALWFWSRKSGAYIAGTKANGKRPALHHVMWSEHHKQSVPRGHVISFIDGNPNNLVPSNLRLRSRNDLVSRNHAKALAEKSRARVQLLLARQREGGTQTIRNITQRSRAT